MRRLTLFISVALALLAFAIPATAGAKSSHHKSRHHRLADRNHNGMPDRWERKFRVHKASSDPDRDGVTNLGEFHNGTNPRDADTDNDGIDDGNDDANHDGVEDGQEQAGVIDTFDANSGKLTIKLVNGDSLAGTVNGDTEIECENPAPAPTASTRDGGETETGDDSPDSSSTTSGDTTEHQSGDQTTGSSSTPSGDDEQGDDNNDQGENENEDHGSCGTAALVQNTIVREAELKVTQDGAVFHSIKLGGMAPA